jgi:ubiquitin carboxyl-terminal hydrolase 14
MRDGTKLSKIEKRVLFAFASDHKSPRQLIPTRQPGTLEWVLVHREFLRWTEDKMSVPLWISGNPGMGKTVLSLFLVELFEKQGKQEDLSTRVIYFFCNDQDETRKTGLSLLKALIHQCLQSSPFLIQKYVIPEYETLGDKLYTSFAGLWDIFTKITCDPAFGRVYCVLDALDECEERSRNQLIRCISTHFTASPTPLKNLRLILTSRPYDSIRSELLYFPIIRLEAEKEEHHINSDIAIYVGAEVQNLALRRGYTEDLKDRVGKTLRSSADGMFLWVSLAVTILKQTPIGKVEKRLTEVPRSIDEVYKRVLLEIPEGSEEEVFNILKHVLFAFRPLTLMELGIVCGMKPDHKSASSIPPEMLHGIRGDVELCGPLLKVQSNRTVHLVHHSAKEFLLGSRYFNLQTCKFIFNEPTVHFELAKTCVQYLSFEELARGPLETAFWLYDEVLFQTILQQRPFLEYAAVYWYRHIHQAKDRQPELFDLVRAVLSSKSKRDFFFQVHQYHYRDHQYAGNQTPLHFLVRVGLQLLIGQLLTSDRIEIDAVDDFGWTALHWASRQGHDAEVRLLLENGANLNLADKRDGWLALDLAVVYGHETVVQILVEEARKRSDKDVLNKNALSLAAENGRMAIVLILIENGADLSSHTGRIALHQAIEGRHTAVVQLLLQKGADVDATDRLGRTPLFLAACYEQLETVKLLLEGGAKTHTAVRVAADVGLGGTALDAARRNGNRPIIGLLLGSAKFDEEYEARRYDARLKQASERLEHSRNDEMQSKATESAPSISLEHSHSEMRKIEAADRDNDVVHTEHSLYPLPSVSNYLPVVGIYNLGRTGWLNSVIQLLYSMPDLRREIALYDPPPGQLVNITTALRDLFQQMSDADTAISPDQFFRILGTNIPLFRNRLAMQDAEEVWYQLVIQLRRELKVRSPPSSGSDGSSFIDKYMMGRFESVLSRVEQDDGNMEESVVSFDNFMTLNSHINNSTTHLAQSIIAPLIENVEKRSVVLNRDAFYQKSSRVSRLPKYLTVNLVRFFWSRAEQRKIKIIRKVEVPLELDATELCTEELKLKLIPVRDKLRELRKVEGLHNSQPHNEHSNETETGLVEVTPESGTAAIEAARTEVLSLLDPGLAADGGSNKSGLYELRGIITHDGQSTQYGHYCSFVKQELRNASQTNRADPNTGNWWILDDHKISEADGEQIAILARGGKYIPFHYRYQTFGNQGLSVSSLGLTSAVMLLYEAVPLPECS